MGLIRFIQNRLGMLMSNINHASEFCHAKLGTDLKYLKQKWGVVETLPSSPGSRVYKTKDGNIIRVYSTDNSLEIVSDAISILKDSQTVKNGTFIGATKYYRNLAYPNIGKKGIVTIDRDKYFYYYKKGADGETIPYYGFKKDIVSDFEYSNKTFPLSRANNRGIKYETVVGGWQTPLNVAVSRV